MHKISTALSALAIVMVLLPVSLSAQNNNKIEATGNVGIGTTTPPNRLTIESTDPLVPNYIRMEHKGIPNSVLFFGTAPSNYQVTLHQNANVLESYTDLHISAANTGRIFFETGRTGTAAPVRMTLTNVGLGIGTTTPTTAFNLEGSAIRHKNPTGYPWGVNIDVDYPATWIREYSITHGATGKLFAWGVNGNGSALNYAYIGGNSTAESVSSAPWMTFRPDGDVGIGTTNPAHKLDIAGGSVNIGTGANVAYRAGSYVSIGNMSYTNTPYIAFNAFLTTSDIATAKNLVTPTYNAGSGLIIRGEGGGSGLHFLQKNYANGTAPYDVNSFTEVFTITSAGTVGVGTASTGVHKLAVEGSIGARRVKVNQTGWADFVFSPDYKLPALDEVEKYINENQHLPEIPSAAEVQKEGLDLGEMNKKLLQKVEELTLYLIEQQKVISALQTKDAWQEARLRALESK